MVIIVPQNKIIDDKQKNVDSILPCTDTLPITKLTDW